MAEPTLGQRIAGAALEWKRAEVFAGPSSAEAAGAWADFRALCESVDAAERLARAADALEAAYSGHGVNRSVDDHQAALGVFHEALAAWREVRNG